MATCDFPFGEEKLVAPLIAIPNVDNANRRQEENADNAHRRQEERQTAKLALL